MDVRIITSMVAPIMPIVITYTLNGNRIHAEQELMYFVIQTSPIAILRR
jgi:hypothetical protein